MDDGDWIIVPNWGKFQHYRDRNPAWIKLYTELNRRDDWRALTFSLRGLQASIWPEYGVADGLLRASDLGSRLGQRVDSRALASLSDAGFIQLSASRPLALARSREKMLRGEKNSARARKTEHRQSERANVVAGDPVAAIERLIRNGVITDPLDLDAEIAGYHLDGDLAGKLRAMLP